jgi:hypothetical protein
MVTKIISKVISHQPAKNMLCISEQFENHLPKIFLCLLLIILFPVKAIETYKKY